MVVSLEIRLDLDFVVNLVKAGGFALRHPQRHEVVQIDDRGDSHVVDETTLDSELCMRKTSRFQLWEQRWAGPFPGDLYCRVQFRESIAIVEFGELPRMPDDLLRSIWAAFRRLADDGDAVGLVVDLSGDTDDYADWVAFFDGLSRYAGPCPDLLSLRKSACHIIPHECTHLDAMMIGNQVVMCTPRLSALVRSGYGV